MISRVIKNQFRMLNRLKMKEISTLSEEEFTKLALNYFNELLSPTSLFWKVPLQSILVKKFGASCLTAEEKAPDYDLRSDLDLSLLFQVLQIKTGKIQCR
jgi:hypothetical protein